MQHLHFQTIPSTQIYLREHLKDFTDNDVLISCSEQTEGIGRTGNIWDFYPQSLAMSFTIPPHQTPSLTPLEIGVIISKFFKEQFNLQILLKWPNDLMTVDSKKCGGIICQYINPDLVIAGLGINFGSHIAQKKNSYLHGFSSLPINFSSNENLALEIYKYILNNRIETFIKLEKEFSQTCSHLNKNVEVTEGRGIFKGIGENGEALIIINNEIKKVYSSSLNILSDA